MKSSQDICGPAEAGACGQELVVLLEDLAEVWLYLCHSAAPLLDGPIAISFLGQSAALADCAAGELAVPSLAACMAVQHGLTELLARLLVQAPTSG